MRYRELTTEGRETASQPRLDSLEHTVRALSQRVATLERRVGVRSEAPVATATAPVVAPRPAAPAPVPVPAEPAGPRLPKLEELLGGRLLALAGAATFLLGVAFFVALAVDRGWIGETMRISLAFAVSTALLGVGIWLHERRGKTQASLAIVGTAVAALYLTLTAATALYELIPQAPALVLAFVIGAITTGIAVRWNTRTVGGLGILGALVSPVLIGATAEGSTLTFLAVALASAAGVLLWRRWDWLGVAAFLVVMPQLALWALDSPPTGTLLLALAGFAALNLTLALGYELRSIELGLRPSSSLLVSFNALLVAALGAFVLVERHGETAGGTWIAGLAVTHVVLGILALRSRRISEEIGLLLAGTGLVLANIAFGLLADGPVLAAGWAASAVGLAALTRVYARQVEVFRVAIAGQLSLAAAHALLFDAPPGVLNGDGEIGISSVSVLATFALAAFGAARLATGERKEWQQALDGLSLLTVLYVSALTLDGGALVLAWTGIAVALGRVARQTGDQVAAYGALCFLGLAAGHVLLFEAPPRALVDGVDDLLTAAVSLCAVALAALALSRFAPEWIPVKRIALLGVAAAAAVYLASVGIISEFQPGEDAIESVRLDVLQQGQVLLSLFWSLCGLAALFVGLRRGGRELRLAGFGLLLLALTKVFLYDLATLDSLYRVASFVVLGLLLLTAAFVYQRLRASLPG